MNGFAAQSVLRLGAGLLAAGLFMSDGAVSRTDDLGRLVLGLTVVLSAEAHLSRRR